MVLVFDEYMNPQKYVINTSVKGLLKSNVDIGVRSISNDLIKIYYRRIVLLLLRLSRIYHEF